MIEQINISALEQKGSVEHFIAWVIETCRQAQRQKRHIHQLKVMKNEHPAFFPPNGTMTVNSLNCEGIAVIELQFTTFLTVTDCVLALSQTK